VSAPACGPIAGCRAGHDAATPGTVAALFDVDNTLFPGATSERLFVRALMRGGEYGARAALDTVATVLRHARRGPFVALRLHRPYLRGRTVAEVATLAERVFAREIVPRLAPRGAARVRWHLERGHRVALLSGAPHFLAELLAAYLGVGTILATPLAVEGGRYTGELADLHPYGARKAILARRFATAQGVALADAYAYADHHSDAPLLALCGHPVCVNPTARLRRIAAREGWPTETWDAARPAAARRR
jgi:HAD superfamily hydrolase (TIGR01490 family)